MKSLILVDARIGSSPESSDALQEQVDRVPLETAALDEVVEVIRDLYPDIPPETRIEMAEGGYRLSESETFVPKCDLRMSLQVEDAGFEVESLWHFLEIVSCPTLVVRGADSPFVTKEDLETVCRALPEARCCDVPWASHLPAQENPNFFFKEVFGFLQGLV